MIIRQRVVPSGVMSKSMRVALIVTLAVFVLGITGVAIGLLVYETDQPAATSTPNPNAIECANIDRAYNSWSIGRLAGMYEYEGATVVDMRTEMDDQQELLEAVQGYDGQPSRDLALAVATFGAELATLNAEVTIAGSASLDQASVVADAQKNLRAGYVKWKAATCG